MIDRQRVERDSGEVDVRIPHVAVVSPGHKESGAIGGGPSEVDRLRAEDAIRLKQDELNIRELEIEQKYCRKMRDRNVYPAECRKGIKP